jgi:type II secretion system protein H
MAQTELLAEKVRTKTSTAGNNNGVTLLELLVVLFIIGLATAMVIFSAGRMRDNSVFREEARKIYLTAKHAREVAILERQDVALKIDEEGNRYWLDYGGDKTSEMHAIPKKYPLSGKDLYFFPKGKSSGGLIEIRNEKGQKYAITVDQVLGTSSIKRL